MRRRNHLSSKLTLPTMMAFLIVFCGGLGAEEQQNGTVIRSEGLVVILGGDFSGPGDHDLADVAVRAEFTFGNEVLVGSGMIRTGSYRVSSGVTFSASLALTGEFGYTAGPIKARLTPGGSLDVDVKKSSLRKASFDTPGTVHVEVPKSGDMSLAGTLKGTLDGGGIDIDPDARLNLVEPFEYEKDRVTVSMHYGQVGVEVKEDKFQKATLSVDGELEVEFEEGAGLHAGGMIEGTYESGELDLRGTITLMRPFEYTFGPVTARIDNGTVRVEVEKSEFTWATEEAVVEVDVAVPNTGPIQLVGEPSVKVENDSMDIEGVLSLREPYTFSDATSRTTLTGGETRFRVKKGKLAPLVFSDLVYRVEIVVEGDDGRAKVEDGKIKLRADDLKDRGMKALSVEPTGPSDQNSDV